MSKLNDAQVTKLTRNQLIDAFEAGNITGDQFRKALAAGPQGDLVKVADKVEFPMGPGKGLGAKLTVAVPHGWPVTTYFDNVLHILDNADAIRAYITEHQDELASYKFAPKKSKATS